MKSQDDMAQSLPITINKDDLFIMQLEQAISTYRQQYGMMIQIIGVIVTANLTIVGYGLISEKSGVFLIGALLPLFLIRTIYRAYMAMKPVIYTAINLESRFSDSMTDLLMTTFTAINVSRQYADKMIEISKIENRKERFCKLNALTPPHFYKRFGGPLLIFVGILQILLGSYLYYFHSWNLI